MTNALTVNAAVPTSIERMVFDAGEAPHIRMRWNADTVVSFKGTTSTIAEHAKQHGACIVCMMPKLRAGSTFHLALRDARPKRACARDHSEFMREVSRQYGEALRAGEPAADIFDRMAPNRTTKRGNRK